MTPEILQQLGLVGALAVAVAALWSRLHLLDKQIEKAMNARIEELREVAALAARCSESIERCNELLQAVSDFLAKKTRS